MTRQDNKLTALKVKALEKPGATATALGFGFRLARRAAKVGCLDTCTARRFTWAWVQRNARQN
jgi:hypothetical protein